MVPLSCVVAAAAIDAGRDHDVAFKLDAFGQAIRRDESHSYDSTGDPHEIWYRFNGREMGHVGNDGTYDTDYAASIADRGAVTSSDAGAFRHEFSTGSKTAMFGEAYVPFTSFAQGESGGSYTVQAGDTLAGLASQLWGDASLWYKLAEANGITGATSLVEGQHLTIPAGVARASNTASTFKPYDPAEAAGNTSPTTPKKPKSCGALGMVITAAIAIAVAAYLGPEMLEVFQPMLGSFAGAVVAGAVTGAAASIVSQGVGVAIGAQDNFSWKAVGLAAIGGAVGGALNPGGGAIAHEATHAAGSAGAGIAGGMVGGVLRAVAGNAISQGIGKITGLQDKFSWAGVAAAGVIGAVGGKLGRSSNPGVRALASAAASIAGAATRSVLTGTDFGDNLVAVLPDVIAQTIGDTVKDALDGQTARGELRQASNGVSDLTVGKAGHVMTNGNYLWANGQEVPEPIPSDEDGMSSAVADVGENPDIIVIGRQEDIGHQKGGWLETAYHSVERFVGNLFGGKKRSQGRYPYAYPNFGIPHPRVTFRASPSSVSAYSPYSLAGSLLAQGTSRSTGGEVRDTERDAFIGRAGISGLPVLGPALNSLLTQRNAAAIGRGADDFVRHDLIGGIQSIGGFADDLSSAGLSRALLSNFGITTPGPNANNVFMPFANALNTANGWYTSRSLYPQLLLNDVTSVYSSTSSGVRAFASQDADTQFEQVLYYGTRGTLNAGLVVATDGIARGSAVFAAERLPTQLELNGATGKAFQARVGNYGNDTLQNFVEEVSIRPNTATGQALFKIRADGLGTNPDTLMIDLLEAKGSAAAPLTKNQTLGFPLLEQYGGTIVGAKGGVNYPAGTVISPGTKVQIIRPSNIPRGY